MPLVTASHVRDGLINFSIDPQFIAESQYVEWMRRGFPDTGDVLMTMGQMEVSTLPMASTTLNLMLKVPAAVGAPEIAPVVGLSVRPAGSVP